VQTAIKTSRRNIKPPHKTVQKKKSKMTIKTNFEHIIANPDDEQTNYPRHLIDADQFNNLEFVVGLELLDEDARNDTISSTYSDDDSTIESSSDSTEGHRVDLSADGFESSTLEATSRTPRRRRTSRRRLEEMMEILGLESLLALRRGEPSLEEDSVDLARNRVGNEGTRHEGDSLEEDSLRLTRARGVRPLLNRNTTRRDQEEDDDDDEEDYSINLRDSSMPVSSSSSSMPRGSTVHRSWPSDSSLRLARTRGVPLLSRRRQNHQEVQLSIAVGAH
jgi:hypothetical protein